ncbi:MAG: hypothetical protein AAF944_27405 [Bacteroidota bacterium]
MAALSVVSGKGGMADYRELGTITKGRGKNKMSVINAVRANLVHCIFALIREDRLYEPIHHNNLC